MPSIDLPKPKSISQTKMLFDGIAHGREYRSPRPSLAPTPIVSPSMIRARRQLDAVLLRQETKKSPLTRFRHEWRRLMIFRRFFILSRRLSRKLNRYLPEPGNLSPKKALYASLFAGVSFGMVSMSVIQDIKGDDASAQSAAAPVSASETVNEEAEKLARELSSEKKYDPSEDLFLQFFSEAEKEEYRKQIEELVKGHPIEDMLPYILEKDRIVAAFLIGIAKKESNWGKRVPVLDNQDCFNYWGYRGVRRLMGTGGHTCFNSRKDAVDTVALRIESLVYSSKLDTPAKMIIWKCGYSCDGHSRESVQKWIADVDMYFKELNQEESGT